MAANADFSPYEEHRFWLEILDDHAHFVRDYLSPTEGQWVRLAQQYIDAFHGLRIRLSQLNPQQLDAKAPEMVAISQSIYPVAAGYYRFEGEMQRLRILNEVNLNLTPTYLNGTLNENQEYLRLLQYYVQGRQPVPLSLTDLLDLWLEDQLGQRSKGICASSSPASRCSCNSLRMWRIRPPSSTIWSRR